MEARLKAEIDKLPVIHKAHIYEPKIDDVAEISFKAGKKVVVEWVNKNIAFANIPLSYKEWHAQLKEWGL